MEVTVTDANGLPEGCLLSIRAGMTRRQAPVPLTEPLRFPNLPVNAKQFKVDVLQTLGSARLDIEAKTDLEQYRVQLELNNGCKASVGLTVREESSLCGKRASELKQLEQSTRADATRADASKASRDTREYANEHNIPNVVQEMLANVLRERPAAPYSAMASYLRRQSQQRNEPGCRSSLALSQVMLAYESVEEEEDLERLQLEAEHLALLAERALVRKELASLPSVS